MSKKLISIIIPVFNAENYLENTLNSIKNQTFGFSNLEIIFVDDCSTDNSKKILENFSEKYENVKSIFLDENHSYAGEARNVGIVNSTSDYLMFLDSDDIFYPEACEFLYTHITTEKIDLVSGNYVVSVNGEKTYNKWEVLNLTDNKLFVNEISEKSEILLTPPAIMSKIYKRSIIIDNNIRFPVGVAGEDLVFSTNYFLKSKGILFIDFPIFEYIIRNEGENKSVSYERGKNYLIGLTDSYRDLFYLLNSYNKDLNYTGVSRLHYWIYQFILSNLTISDRIELLKYVEFLFIEFDKIERLKPSKDHELIFDLIKSRKFYEASKLCELINIKNSTPENKLDEINKKLSDFEKSLGHNHNHIDFEIKFSNELADMKLELDFLKHFYIDLNIPKAIKLIKKWNLFDEKYYRKAYNYNLNVNPLLHYIFIGYKENKNPSEIFDGNFYQNFYDTVKKSHMNPLVYFVMVGVKTGEVRVNEKFYAFHKQINHNEFNEKLHKFNECGLNSEKRDEKIILSLTSFPERIDEIKFTLYSLLNQNLKPDKLVLWLAREQFPNGEKDIPKDVLNLKKNGLSIRWCNDLGSYKKLIPSLKEYSNDIIVTADDDLFYHENWLKQLYSDHKLYPNNIISQRVRKIKLNNENILQNYSDWELTKEEELPSFLNFSTNGAGSLFPPNSLHKDILNEELFHQLCPSGDDIWVWAMAVLNKTKIKGVADNMAELIYVNVARELNILNQKTLYSVNALNNDSQIKNILEYYPLIMKTILEDEDKVSK